MSCTTDCISVPRGYVGERQERDGCNASFICPPAPINIPSEYFTDKLTFGYGPERTINLQESSALEGARGIVVGLVLGSIAWGLLGLLGYALLF